MSTLFIISIVICLLLWLVLGVIFLAIPVSRWLEQLEKKLENKEKE